MKRRFLIALIVPALWFVFLSPVSKASALSSGCSNLNYTTIGTPSASGTGMFDKGDKVTIAAATPFNVSGFGTATSVSSYSYTIPTTGTYTYFLLSNPFDPADTFNLHCSHDPSVTFLNFDDGRLNSHDGAETAAVYCESGGVTVYAVVKSVGTLAFKVTKAELAAVPARPNHNTLIKSGLGVSLYRLTTGELQINAPDNYVFIWDGCAAV